MLGWAIGFFVLAIVAGVFGFGGIATAFTGIAVILFWVFIALFVLSLIFGAFGGSAHATGTGSGSPIGVIALVAVVALGVYVWMHNDMSAQRVGASIDHTASQVAENTSRALDQAGDRAQEITRDTTHAVQNDTANGLRDAGDHVDPDNSRNN